MTHEPAPGTVRLILDFPVEVYDLLKHRNPKGAPAAVRQAVKAYLMSGRPTKNAARDLEICAKANAGTRQAILAKEYGLSLIRIQQIVAAGRTHPNSPLAEYTPQEVNHAIDTLSKPMEAVGHTNETTWQALKIAKADGGGVNAVVRKAIDHYYQHLCEKNPSFAAYTPKEPA